MRGLNCWRAKPCFPRARLPNESRPLRQASMPRAKCAGLFHTLNITSNEPGCVSGVTSRSRISFSGTTKGRCSPVWIDSSGASIFSFHSDSYWLPHPILCDAGALLGFDQMVKTCSWRTCFHQKWRNTLALWVCLAVVFPGPVVLVPVVHKRGHESRFIQTRRTDDEVQTLAALFCPLNIKLCWAAMNNWWVNQKKMDR